MPTQEQYKSKEFPQKIKQALATLSLDLYFPGHHKHDPAKFLTYIALQYHLTICFLKQEPMDLLSAINTAEQSKMDMLKVTGSRTDPRMRPFYTLLLNIYSIHPEPTVKHAGFLSAYTELLQKIHPAAIGTPDLPNLDGEEFNAVNFSIPIQENVVAANEIKMLTGRLYAFYMDENEIFFGSKEFESSIIFEHSNAIADVLRQISEKHMQQKDLANAIISMQRAGALLLAALITRFGNAEHPAKKAAMLATMQRNYAQISLLTTVDFNFSAIQTENATIFGVKSSPRSGNGRSRANSYRQFDVT